MDGLGTDAARLLLVDDADATIEVAAELRGGATFPSLSAQDANAAAIESIWGGRTDLVVIELTVPDIIARLRAGGSARPVSMPLIDGLVGCRIAEVERALLLRTLEHCQGNRTSASTVLGISVRTMRNKLRTFLDEGIDIAPAA
ncbi:MAG TPA: helix-turn-helix domain-containing protein [Sphingobium sp.]|uniref:helix-turn-helix domain-containing protein n=1 Tax=Sphingobium sp. TaxID=1912891 RepID=UPI002ED0FE29